MNFIHIKPFVSDYFQQRTCKYVYNISFYFHYHKNQQSLLKRLICKYFNGYFMHVIIINMQYIRIEIQQKVFCVMIH